MLYRYANIKNNPKAKHHQLKISDAVFIHKYINMEGGENTQEIMEQVERKDIKQVEYMHTQNCKLYPKYKEDGKIR